MTDWLDIVKTHKGRVLNVNRKTFRILRQLLKANNRFYTKGHREKKIISKFDKGID